MSIGVAIFMELFVTIHYTVFFFIPASHMIGKNDKKKQKKSFAIMFATRAIALLVLNFVFVWVAIIDFLLLFVLVFGSIPFMKNRVIDINKYNEITDEQIKEIMANFNIETFKSKVYKTFYDVQMAWMDFDYDKLKDLLTDELYNTYVMDLDALKLKNQKNVMKDFQLLDNKLIYLEEQNDKYIARVVLEVKFYDYIEDSKTHKVLRGSSRTKLDNTYVLTFERTKKRRKRNICPQCGAPVDGNSTGICEYCKSKLINDNYDWVMSKKEKISQK